MKDLNANQSRDVFEVLRDSIGLQRAKVELIELPSFERKIQLALIFDVPVDPYMSNTSNKPFMEFFREIRESVLSSKAVREEIKLLEDKLKMANAASDELLGRIKELEKYKTHHDLEMELRHGQKK